MAKKPLPKKARKPVAAPAKHAKPAPKPARKSSAALEGELKRLDREILTLINKRTAATTEWILAQPDLKRALFSPLADDALFAALESSNQGPLPMTAVRGIFRQMLCAARQEVKTTRVAYLGPAYSYTHIAALERFGESADLVPVSTIAAVFEEVNRGQADYGIVPIENSTDGRIVDTLDMFTRLPLRICGEVQIAIHHNLLSRCPRSEINEIYSKPQALSQCREWLNKNMPQARLLEVTSTSTAAQLARDKPGAGAVASMRAAVEYDLSVAAESIQDNKNNVTRFAIIGDDDTKPTGRDRTALLLQIPHKPGALADALSSFKRNKINLTWIESFPLRGPESGYLFFLDFEGHAHDPRIKRTLADIERLAVRMEVLGSYPRSEPLS
jgi:chorismate mutase/prephenate dehydratase